MNTANLPAIPVAFANLFTGKRLAQTTLPALPHSGDTVYLRLSATRGHLAYEVAYCKWRLVPTGLTEIVVLLRPQLNADEQRPLSYPEEADLWDQWQKPPAKRS